ncbi:MAG: thioredoxin domain-containing protein, partial [Chthoniobacterales bacterium]|nr:thioredoxin domain-containing protein [Chthoniobacterales bacterium]
MNLRGDRRLLFLLRLAIIAALLESGVAGAAEEKYTNRLINEKSPYLLQHAHNPVDWYPWGKEAFEKAKKENKPIFLSVGYSTCHWCHVMEHESFENPEIAKMMNDNFVSIKVDREERPDVDQVYMTFVQATTGGGGWPMSVWLTPDLKPFVGGTYFPPENRGGQPGFKSVLKQIAEAWKKDREKIVTSSDRIVAELQRISEPGKGAPDKLEQGIRRKAYEQFAAIFDEKLGGFGDAPKFPRPVIFNFLYRVYAGNPDSSEGKHALEMTLFTLRKMAEGGIHDHIGGGFHRYSTDKFWHVPHFEKMLYDQAQLALAYLDAFQITREPTFEKTARDILDYVRRDMTDPDGGFYSAEDADSLIEAGKPAHAEGAFYVWTKEEIDRALGLDRAKIFDYHFGVEPTGNAPEDPQGEF